jgi:mannose-1-phosphate guanylyltransferase
VLLSAGRGTRLAPLTQRLPKAIFPVLDVPLGGFGLAELMQVSANVYINVHAPARDIIRSALRPVAARGSATVTFAEEFPQPFGAAGTLVALREQLAATVIVWNADTITDLAAQDLLAAHAAADAPATIAVVPVERGADVSFQGELATSYIDRRARSDASGGQFMGASVFQRELLERLPQSGPLGLAEALLEPLVREGDLAIHVHSGYAIDVGTFARYLQASTDLLEGRGPAPPLPWPGDVVQLEPGPAYVGPGASASDGTLGPGAVLLRDAVVHAGAFVKRAIIWPGAIVPSGTRVSNTVWFDFVLRAAPLSVPELA